MNNQQTINPQHRNYHKAVGRFGGLMVAKLIENDHKGHWRGCDMEYLFRRLDEEVAELKQSVMTNGFSIDSDAADVGNFAMMIAERAEAEMQQLRWLELMNSVGIVYMLSHDGIDFINEQERKEATELARKHNLHYVLEKAGTADQPARFF